ncbi:phosphoribosyltransferase-like protein [Chitinophaga sancti]|uniref:PRTase-CE domain-containing protein n=1 Tax=Chitinophaga sancti TaxID=1004 RepID=A0A1K1T1C1_9BACT|nr:hypothetical protein [Chitinophaga sancti]WQD63955.1 hypothetical protein U0033_06065 [Chitinophaga sancti]WQG90420.1 hypothetical protein SR876_02855 [Chitinophaga sancti]SFW90326.1 hypothetical protein SAMN05661012_06593 [Chitinophaga sancti]
MLGDLSKKISTILNDYENNRMTEEHVVKWVCQFDEADRVFILEELSIIFEKTYLTKDECKNFLKVAINYLTKTYGYSSGEELMVNTVILDLQKDGKSQKELIDLLGEVLQENYNMTLDNCGQTHSHYLYLDDVLATGNTLFTNLCNWLKSSNAHNAAITNYEYIKQKDIKVSLCFTCLHSWGANNTEYRLMMEFDDKIKKYIKFSRAYEIENNAKAYNSKLNLMIPIADQPNEIKAYLTSLDADKYEDRAYRKEGTPISETLFSSAANRIRLENIFLRKGIEILSQVKTLTVKQIRPLGYTIKSHKTFGLGTMFFTYRNIPNNCPIVFWWGNNWYPLFNLKNRGNS